MSSSDSTCNSDLESNSQGAFLVNQTVANFAWKDVSVTVNKSKKILSSSSGYVSQGELLVLMGPSGSGKTTLLNALAHRATPAGAIIEGDIMVNGKEVSLDTFQQISSYVEQEDVLIGSLTVEETLYFAAKLSLPSSITKKERMERITSLLNAFGIQDQAKSLIGTPIRKGISGGQKRRVGVASRLITCPRILFLDEPTTGLDSTASFEVMSFVKNLAKSNKIIVIASVHQPSTAVFGTFDKLLVLSGGMTCYFGAAAEMKAYFDHIGHVMPQQTNPAEFILDLVNTDFVTDKKLAESKLLELHSKWDSSPRSSSVDAEIERITNMSEKLDLSEKHLQRVNFLVAVLSLLHRSFIKSYRDIVAYGIRAAMYLGLAILMGTVWLQLKTSQEYIQPYINATFFGLAFMSFMAVAYVPSFLEDRATFVKERANGLYGATEFMVSNFFIGLPFLFLISLFFSLIAYWLSNFRPDGSAFFIWVMWLFLDLLAAESLVVLVSSMFPNFVVALALTAFVNGLWMCVSGFLVSPKILNVFWKYAFHYIDYQTYVFQGMMVNEFSKRTYSCGSQCQCMYQTELASQCKIAGTGVLDVYGYKTGETGKWVGILIGITAGFRLLGWILLVWRKR